MGDALLRMYFAAASRNVQLQLEFCAAAQYEGDTSFCLHPCRCGEYAVRFEDPKVPLTGFAYVEQHHELLRRVYRGQRPQVVPTEILKLHVVAA